MMYICVICMVKRPPLSPLSAEHRTLLEAIVSPVLNTDELKAWHWLQCADCKVLMKSVYDFQQTALLGVKNLKHFYHELNKTVTINEGVKPKKLVSMKTTPEPATLMPAPIKKEEDPIVGPIKLAPEPEVLIPTSKDKTVTVTEPRNVDPLTEEIHVKIEHESRSESDPEPECDSEATLSCESDHNNPSDPTITYISAPSTVKVRVIPKLPPEPVKNDEKFEVFTHRPRPSQHPGPYLTNIRWKGGVGEPLRIRKKPKHVKVPCPHCGEPRDKLSLKVHIARMHGEMVPCNCDVCGKQCRNQAVLKTHKKNTHKKIDPAAFCVQCDMQYRDMAQYKKHLRTTNKHAAESDFRYKCDVCGRKFISNVSLLNHSTVHTDLVYPCGQCDQTFKSKAGRRTHVRMKHDGRVLPRDKLCDYCGKGFASKARLSSHINTHTGARPFVCKVCGADFGHKSALYLHGRYKHKIPKKNSDGKKDDKEKHNSGEDLSEKVNSEKGINEKDNCGKNIKAGRRKRKINDDKDNCEKNIKAGRRKRKVNDEKGKSEKDSSEKDVTGT